MTKRKLNLQLPSFEVIYWNKKTLEESGTANVTTVPLNNLNKAKALQEKLIRHFVELNGSMAELLTNEAVVKDMQDLAAILPTIENDKPGFDLQNLFDASDYIQLAQIFFTESYTVQSKAKGLVKDGDMGLGSLYYESEHRYNPLPSKIARIHDFIFFDKIQEIRKEVAEKQRKEQEKQLKEIEEAIQKTEQLEEETTSQVAETPK